MSHAHEVFGPDPRLAALLGGFNGLVGAAVLWWLELQALDLPHGTSVWLSAHRASPALWMVDLLPLFMAAIGYLLARNLRREAPAPTPAPSAPVEGPTRRQLEARIESLERQRDQAVRANQLKSEYLASASHELRTPLNAIIGYGEMLLEDVALGQLPEEDDARRVVRSATQLLELINNVLDLSKIEAGRMSVVLEPIDVRQLVDEVAETVRPLAGRGGNAFEVEVEPRALWVRGDRMRLRQILINLLGNAFKFTSDGQVRLVAVREEREGLPWICFQVVDNGVGMSPDQVSQLFQDYSQVGGSAVTRAQGTGLGLAISQRLADMMAGRVEVSSTVGVGSTFTLVMPAPAETPGPVPRRRAPAGVAGTVLWIDDDPRLGAITRQLNDEGWSIMVANSVSAGRDQLDVTGVVALILDVSLGDGGGWQLLEDLGNDAPDLPIVVASVDDDVERAYHLGAAGFVPKPLEPERVAAALSRLALLPATDDPPGAAV